MGQSCQALLWESPFDDQSRRYGSMLMYTMVLTDGISRSRLFIVESSCYSICGGVGATGGVVQCSQPSRQLLGSSGQCNVCTVVLFGVCIRMGGSNPVNSGKTLGKCKSVKSAGTWQRIACRKDRC